MFKIKNIPGGAPQTPPLPQDYGIPYMYDLGFAPHGTYKQLFCCPLDKVLNAALIAIPSVAICEKHLHV